MTHESLAVLYEDDALLVLNKPVGLATAGVPEGEPSLHRLALAYLRDGGEAEPFLGCVSRLDVPVGGIVVMAKTSEAARSLSAQFRVQAVRKIYHALVSGGVRPESATLRHWLVKRGIHSKVRCVPEGTPGAREACLTYTTLQTYGHATLLAIELHTGRKHQIRTQLSRIGHPIWGDYKYGSRMELTGGIALVAKELGLVHPQTGVGLDFQVDYPPHWPYDVETLSHRDRTWLGRGDDKAGVPFV